MRPPPQTILITGASSGIGAALARHYAAPRVTLLLTGRHNGRLAAIAKECEARGARVVSATIDVCSREPLAAWLLAQDEATPIDLAIANAGISGGTAGRGIHGETPEQVQAIFNVNVGGVLNTVLPLLPRFTARRKGQIALMSSLAALRGLPSAPAYSASKAAVKAYGDALRGYVAPAGVRVSVIVPGYIRTPMTDANRFPMPFLIEPEAAAKRIAGGLARNEGIIAFPLRMYLPWLLFSILPWRVADPMLARLPGKPPLPGQENGN